VSNFSTVKARDIPHADGPAETQLPLVWGEHAITSPQYEPQFTHREKFEAFHAANPHVFQEFARRALMLRRQGRERYGAKSIFEGMRWDWAKRTNDPASDFALNNNYTAFYARLAVERHQELEGFFEMRTRRGEA